MIKSDSLKDIKWISHAFFTRKDGMSQGIYGSLNCGIGSGDDKEFVKQNRAIALKKLGAEKAELRTLYQIHSNEVVVATKNNWDEGNIPKADAMVTKEKGVVISVLTADCVPVIFADQKKKIVGVAHAGWKGALNGVLENTVLKMEEIGAKRSNIIAVMGPCITQKSYEVSEDFRKTFLEQDRDNYKFFVESSKASHFMFNLPAYVMSRLWHAGVGNVDWVGIDTYLDEENFFSYRRSTHKNESDYGRQMSSIIITR